MKVKTFNTADLKKKKNELEEPFYHNLFYILGDADVPTQY